MNSKLPGWMVALLQSRKFWLAVISVIMASVLFVRGDIEADQLVNVILVLTSIVIMAIAAEDSALKLGVWRGESPPLIDSDDEQTDL